MLEEGQKYCEEMKFGLRQKEGYRILNYVLLWSLRIKEENLF